MAHEFLVYCVILQNSCFICCYHVRLQKALAVFTRVMIRDQSGEIFNSYSTGGHARTNGLVKPHFQAMHALIYCHESQALCYNYNIRYSN